MKRAPAALALFAALPSCASAPQPAPSLAEPALHHCRLEQADGRGTLVIEAWMPRGVAPLYYRMGWATSGPDDRVAVTIMPWEGPAVAPPPEATETMVDLAVPAEGGHRPFTLELRRPAESGPEEVAYRGTPTGFRGRLGVMSTCGRLRDRAAGRQLAAIILDRRGRELARDTIDPVLFDAPAAAVAAALPQWQALVRDHITRCPVDPPEEGRIVVTG